MNETVDHGLRWLADRGEPRDVDDVLREARAEARNPSLAESGDGVAARRLLTVAAVVVAMVVLVAGARHLSRDRSQFVDMGRPVVTAPPATAVPRTVAPATAPPETSSPRDILVCSVALPCPSVDQPVGDGIGHMPDGLSVLNVPVDAQWYIRQGFIMGSGDKGTGDPPARWLTVRLYWPADPQFEGRGVATPLGTRTAWVWKGIEPAIDPAAPVTIASVVLSDKLSLVVSGQRVTDDELLAVMSSVFAEYPR